MINLRCDSCCSETGWMEVGEASVCKDMIMTQMGTDGENGTVSLCVACNAALRHKIRQVHEDYGFKPRPVKAKSCPEAADPKARTSNRPNTSSRRNNSSSRPKPETTAEETPIVQMEAADLASRSRNKEIWEE